MTDRIYVWRWELTPLEAYKGQTYWIPPVRKPVNVEVGYFRAAQVEALDGLDELTMTFGVSDKSFNFDVQGIRKEQPDLPVTGDRRSGVLLLKGKDIVASYVMDGSRTREDHRIAVKPEFRGQKLSTRMVLEWYKRTKRPLDLAKQKLNPWSAKSFLAGQREVYTWAVQTGKEVPDKVRKEMETGEETSRILEMLAQVVATGKAAIL